MKSVLLDTNIILDIALAREPFVDKSAELLRKTLAADIIPFISATTVTDIYYIVRKTAGHEKTIRFLENLLMYVKIVGVDSISILKALKSEIKDFEDAILCETAKQNNIEIIITRNEKDFVGAKIQIYSPETYIEKLT